MTGLGALGFGQRLAIVPAVATRGSLHDPSGVDGPLFGIEFGVAKDATGLGLAEGKIERARRERFEPPTFRFEG